MNCPECDEKYLDYLYGELPAADKGVMEEHLKTCPHCTRQLSSLQLIRSTFKQLEQEPRPLVHQRILAHARDSAAEKEKSWLTQWLFRPATALATLVLAAISIYIYTQFPAAPRHIVAHRENPAPSVVAEPGQTLIANARAPIQEVAPSRPSDVLTPVARILPEERTPLQPPSLQGGDAMYAFELGNLYFNQGEFANAITTYSLALTMNPQESQRASIGYQLALSYKKLNDCKSAVRVLDDIQRKNPQYPQIDQVFMMEGDCYLDLGAYDKAESSYTNLISKFPEKQPMVADSLEKARELKRVNVAY